MELFILQMYDQGHNSWEPATILTHCAELVDAFHLKHPTAPCHIAASLFAALPWLPRVVFTEDGPTQSWELGVFGCLDEGLEKGGTVKTLFQTS
jgi:hypothetical protein